jgi:hypothetical protein
MSAWHVGQEVIYRQSGRYARPDRKVTVTRVGRKWVYVSTFGGQREDAFDIVTGRAQVLGGDQIGTAEMFARRDEQAAAVKRVRELTRSFGWPDRMSPEALTKIAELIEAEVIEP